MSATVRTLAKTACQPTGQPPWLHVMTASVCKSLCVVSLCCVLLLCVQVGAEFSNASKAVKSFPSFYEAVDKAVSPHTHAHTHIQ